MLRQLIAIFLLLAVITACSGEDRADARVTMVEAYNPEACGATGYGTGSNNISLRTVLKDASTGESLRGYGRVIIGTGETGMGTGDPNDTRPFICEEGAATGEAVIYISAPGHTPAATAISIPNDTQETVEFMLGKSCTGGQSCYDVTRIRARGDAAREAGMLAMLNGTLSRRFPDDKYVLQCVECDLGRGGFVKLQGAYANGTRFTYYHRFGWCSSGGTDCKDTECFATYTTKVPSSAAAECLQK